MKLKDAKYEVEELPCGKAFVHKWGWGRRFSDIHDAIKYAEFMNLQETQ